MQTQYDEDYFLRGRQSGKSLYENYRWLPELTLPMCNAIASHLNILPGESILDFGCARGYVVRAFTELGFKAGGVDISDWAIRNCDPAVRDKVSNASRALFHRDWTIAKDVMEHLTHSELREALTDFEKYSNRGVFIIVPLASWPRGPYEVEEYERDATHKIRWTLDEWVAECVALFGAQWEVSVRFRLAGVKDNYATWPKGNGFITVRRLSSR